MSRPMKGAKPVLKGKILYGRLNGRDIRLGPPDQWPEARVADFYAREIALIEELGRDVWQPPKERERARREAAAAAARASSPGEGPTLNAMGMERIALRKAAGKDPYEFSWKVEHVLSSIGHKRIDELVVADLSKLIADKVAEHQYLQDLHKRQGDPEAEPLTQSELDHLYVDRGETKVGVRLVGVRRGITAGSINKLVSMVGTWWDEYADENPALENLRRNPAKAKRLKITEAAYEGTWLSPTQALYLIRAAQRQDREAPEYRSHICRAGLIDLAIVTGLRVSELVALDVRSVNLGSGVLVMHKKSKTRAGSFRRISLPERTQGTLRAQIRRLGYSEGLLFPTAHGNAPDRSRFGQQTLARAVRLADEMLTADGLGDHRLPLPTTPHSLRRSMVSFFERDGMDLKRIQRRAGHEDFETTMNLYAKADDDTWDMGHLREVIGDWRKGSTDPE